MMMKMGKYSFICILAAIMMIASLLTLSRSTLFSSHNNDKPLRNTVGRQLAAPHGLGVIHAGRVGATSLRLSLQNRYTPTKLYAKNPEWFTMVRIPVFRYTEWVVILRDPIDRLNAVYSFNHPANAAHRKNSQADLNPTKKFLYNCFDSLDKVALLGLTKMASPACSAVAIRLFRGLKDVPIVGLNEFAYDYDFHFTEFLQQRKDQNIWVVRSENMLQDVTTIDRYLGGSGLHYKKDIESTNEQVVPIKKQALSAMAVDILCHQLCSEILIYRELFIRAKNMDYTSFFHSSIAKRCQKQASLTYCPPTF